jgi:hypothetical protein
LQEKKRYADVVSVAVGFDLVLAAGLAVAMVATRWFWPTRAIDSGQLIGLLALVSTCWGLLDRGRFGRVMGFIVGGLCLLGVFGALADSSIEPLWRLTLAAICTATSGLNLAASVRLSKALKRTAKRNPSTKNAGPTRSHDGPELRHDGTSD